MCTNWVLVRERARGGENYWSFAWVAEPGQWRPEPSFVIDHFALRMARLAIAMTFIEIIYAIDVNDSYTLQLIRSFLDLSVHVRGEFVKLNTEILGHLRLRCERIEVPGKIVARCCLVIKETTVAEGINLEVFRGSHASCRSPRQCNPEQGIDDLISNCPILDVFLKSLRGLLAVSRKPSAIDTIIQDPMSLTLAKCECKALCSGVRGQHSIIASNCHDSKLRLAKGLGTGKFSVVRFVFPLRQLFLDKFDRCVAGIGGKAKPGESLISIDFKPVVRVAVHLHRICMFAAVSVPSETFAANITVGSATRRIRVTKGDELSYRFCRLGVCFECRRAQLGGDGLYGGGVVSVWWKAALSRSSSDQEPQEVY